MRDKSALWIAVVVLIVSVLLSWCIKAYEENAYADWTATEGVVAYTENSSGSRYSRSSLKVYYNYYVDKTQYEGHYRFYIPNIPDEMNSGDSVEVWYNPNKPYKSFLVDPKSETSYEIPFMVGLPIAIFFFFSSIDIKRKNSK